MGEVPKLDNRDYDDILSEVKTKADYIIDTSFMRVNNLKEKILPNGILMKTVLILV